MKKFFLEISHIYDKNVFFNMIKMMFDYVKCISDINDYVIIKA